MVGIAAFDGHPSAGMPWPYMEAPWQPAENVNPQGRNDEEITFKGVDQYLHSFCAGD